MDSFLLLFGSFLIVISAYGAERKTRMLALLPLTRLPGAMLALVAACVDTRNDIAAGCESRKSEGRRKWAAGLVALVAAMGCRYVEAQTAPEGLWRVAGRDTIGHYTGQVEIRQVGAVLRFIRVIDYSDVTAEGDRTLSWVWEGNAAWDERAGALDVAVPLQRADFVRSREGLSRTPSDAQPLEVVGRFVVSRGNFRGRFTAPRVSATEAWFERADLPSHPLFARDVTVRPLDAPLDDAAKAALFQQFASFHALPEVKPYTLNPAFRKAVHSVIVDKTDFDYYQNNPDALRVVGKVLDPISLQETLARANAYRWKLAEKAAFFDEEVAADFIDPVTGMLGEGRFGGRLFPSHNSALWTGTYVASQVDRYRLTGSVDALNNVIRSVQGLLTLVEITGNPRTFARTLRPATGNPTGAWHPGIGAFAHLEWEEGGNNDMFKGVIYGVLSAHTVLCEGTSSHAALCQRIRRDVRHIANDLDIARPSGQNRLAAQWLAAYVTRESRFFVNATTEWAIQSRVLARGNVTMVYSNGIADWSGAHLGLVGYAVFNTLGQQYPLPGAKANDVVVSGVNTIAKNFAKLRIGLWSVAFAAVGVSGAADEARWRLREFPAPKTGLDVDHRISSPFVMSPYPSAPWKNDWTQNDRTQSLIGYPLFEGMAYGACAWTANTLAYLSNSQTVSFPGADYLHAYWLGRQLGVFSASE